MDFLYLVLAAPRGDVTRRRGLVAEEQLAIARQQTVSPLRGGSMVSRGDPWF